MKDLLKNLSLISRGLRYKLAMIFSLMSIIPLLIYMYLAYNFIFFKVEDIGSVSILILLGIIIAILGFILAKNTIAPIIKIALDAKMIANGDLERRVEPGGEDEIGDLGVSLNRLTQTIRSNMDDLKSYGERTKKMNIEIHRKVLALSSLLHIGDRISMAAKFSLDEILALIVKEIAQIEEDSASFLMFFDEDKKFLSMKSLFNIKEPEINKLKIKAGEGLLGTVASTGERLIIDSQIKPKPIIRDLQDSFKLKNILILPLVYSGEIVGILGVGNNRQGFTYDDSDIELIKVFLRQATIAMESDMLLQKTKELATRDELTGLFNENYIKTRLDEEIKRSIICQRPCAFIVFSIDDFVEFRDKYGELVTEKALRKLAQVLEKNTTELDKSARLSGDEFAIVLPEKNKRKAITVAEKIRQEVESYDFFEKEDGL